MHFPDLRVLLKNLWFTVPSVVSLIGFMMELPSPLLNCMKGVCTIYLYNSRTAGEDDAMSKSDGQHAKGHEGHVMRTRSELSLFLALNMSYDMTMTFTQSCRHRQSHLWFTCIRLPPPGRLSIQSIDCTFCVLCEWIMLNNN